MPYSRTIKGRAHHIFANKDEFRERYPNEPIVSTWRKADEDQWCYSDDGQIIMVIKRGTLTDKSRTIEYVRTLLGMADVKANSKLTGIPAKDIYSFAKVSWYERALNGRISHEKRMFAKYVANGIEPVEAYLKANPRTKSIDYAQTKTKILLRSKKVRQLIDKETEILLSDIGITNRYLLEEAKAIIDKPKARDGDKLRALETLMKISGLLNAEKKTDTIAMIQEFTGFSRDKLMAFETGALPDKLKQVTNGSGKGKAEEE